MSNNFWKGYEPEPTRSAIRNTIDMAREAGFDLDGMANMLYTVRGNHAQLALFEALVRADEREQYKWDIHSCGPTCKRYACVAMREAIEAEREACAKLCETLVMGKHCAAAIRAREKA